jgi:hypothetical protein
LSRGKGNEKEKKKIPKKRKKDLTRRTESDIIKMSKGDRNSLRYKKGWRPTPKPKGKKGNHYDEP